MEVRRVCGHHPANAHDGLHDDRRESLAERLEDRLGGSEVVEGQDHGRLVRPRREAARFGKRERALGWSRLGGLRLDDLDAVPGAVVAALDLGDERAACERSREPERVHDGLGSRVAEAHLLE